MTESLRRITWRPATYAGWRGHLTTQYAKLHVATVGWGSTMRDDPNPWKLRMELPGFTTERAFADSEEAKAAAERILTRFTTILNESRDDEVSE